MLNKSLILSIALLLVTISSFVLGNDIEYCLVVGGFCSNETPEINNNIYYYDVPDGTYCLNSTVVQFANPGESCASLECDESYASCVNNTCVLYPYLKVGEKCSDNDQCVGGVCELGVCINNDAGCGHSNLFCKASEWCNGDVCVTRAKKGESCENSKCSIDTFCNQYSNNLCTPFFTLEEDDSCDNDMECNYSKGLICDQNKCIKSSLIVLENCVTSSESCNTDLQYCSYNSTQCETMNFINSECKTKHSNYLSCLVKNNCHYEKVEGILSPPGCVMTNCGTEYCQIAKSCQIAYCGMNYNSFICDPILARTKKPIESEEPSKANILTISKFLIPLFILVSLLF